MSHLLYFLTTGEVILTRAYKDQDTYLLETKPMALGMEGDQITLIPWCDFAITVGQCIPKSLVLYTLPPKAELMSLLEAIPVGTFDG